MKNGMRCQINDWQQGFFRTGKGIPKTKPAKATFSLPLHVILLHIWRSTKDFRAQDSQITNIRNEIKQFYWVNILTVWAPTSRKYCNITLYYCIYFQRLLNKSSTRLLLSSNTIRPGNTWNGIANHVHCDTMSSTFQRNG